MLGRHLIKSWGSTQGPVSPSSGEAGFYGVVEAAGVTLGYSALLEDLGVKLPVRVWAGSTATMGICGRQGLREAPACSYEVAVDPAESPGWIRRASEGQGRGQPC